MAQTFRVIERVYPKNPDWEKRMSAYTVMTNIAIRLIKQEQEEDAEPPEGDSGLVKIRQAV